MEKDVKTPIRAIADEILSLFDNKTMISKTVWHYDATLPYYNEVMSFLLTEGFLTESRDYFAITYKGRLKVEDGGFVGAFERERSALDWARWAAVISTIAAITSLAALIVAFCQI